jgi:hypothetical protein
MVKKVIQKGSTKFSNSAPKWRTPKNNQFFSKSKTSLSPKIIDVHLVAGAKSMGSNWQKGAKIPKEHTGKVWTEAKTVCHELTPVLSRNEQCRQTHLGARISPKLGHIFPWNSHELVALGAGKRSHKSFMVRFARLAAQQELEHGQKEMATCSTRPGKARARPGAQPRARRPALSKTLCPRPCPRL